MDNNQDKIKKQFAALPKDIQQALASSETAERIKNISQRNGLNLDQEERLKTEVAITLFAFEHYSDFIENIRRELEVDLNKAQKVGQEINSEVFRPIKQALRIAHGTTGGETLPPPTPLPTPEVGIQTSDVFNRSVGTPPPTPPTQIPTPPMGEHQVRLDENEDNLNREEILAGIENPVKAPPPKPNYQDDPYREPLK